MRRLAEPIPTRDVQNATELQRRCFKAAQAEISNIREKTKKDYLKRGLILEDKDFELFNPSGWEISWAIAQYELCLQKKCKENHRMRKSITALGDLATDIYCTKLTLMSARGNKTNQQEKTDGKREDRRD